MGMALHKYYDGENDDILKREHDGMEAYWREFGRGPLKSESREADKKDVEFEKYARRLLSAFRCRMTLATPSDQSAAVPSAE